MTDEKSMPDELTDELDTGDVIDVPADSEAEPTEPDTEVDTSQDEIDYEALVEEDLRSLREEFPEMRDAESIISLKNPLRYAALRDLGLTPREAYLATEGRRRAADSRSHLSSAIPRATAAPGCGMSRSELERARELFPGLGDKELMGLYKKVSAK